MNLKRSRRILALFAVFALVFVACDSEGAELTTTSVLITDSVGSGDSATTTVVPAQDGDSTTTAPLTRGQAVDSYEVVGRQSDDAGETLFIVIPPGAYTDVDLENFILDLYESGTATHGAEVFDDSAAVDAYLVSDAERSEAEQELVSDHHFVSLVDGAVIRFQGPFASSGEFPIGS